MTFTPCFTIIAAQRTGEVVIRLHHQGAFRAGVGVALLACLLTVWTTIVRDDGGGVPFFLIVMAAGVGAFAAGLRPSGMARAMLGVAVMQLLLGIAIVTAPSTAALPGGVARALVFNGFFATLWLLSAACFRAVAKRSAGPLTNASEMFTEKG